MLVKFRVMRFCFVIRLMAVSCVLLSGNAIAAGLELNPKELRGDITKKPVSVLENRYFIKQMRPEVGLVLGLFLNEAYTKTTILGVRSALFLNEWIGVEGQLIKTSIADSDDRKALNSLVFRRVDNNNFVTPDPEINPIYRTVDVNAVVAPFYGKLNFMNLMILYSDLYITGGLSQVDTAQGEKSALLVGAGQRFYFLKSLSFRVDYRDRIYNEVRGGVKTRKNAQSIDLGLAYFFL
jgi:outer membrane beta-barrel protein